MKTRHKSQQLRRLVLVPIRLNRANAVRAKLANLGLSEDDVTSAVAWARVEGKHAE
jgi:hypothetical protein